MSETYRAKDDFERGDVAALIKHISSLVQAVSKLVPSDLASRTAVATQGQGADVAPDESDDTGAKPSRSRKRPRPEQPMSPFELARMMGVHMGSPGAREQPPLLQPSPPVNYSITPRRFRPDLQSEDDIIDVTPLTKLPSPPRGLPAPSSSLPAPISPTGPDRALTPAKLDRIANDFIETVLDVIDARQRTWTAMSGPNAGRSGQGPGQGGPWGSFQATNNRTNAGGGAAGGSGGSGGGGGGGRRGGGTGGRGRNPFGGGAWNWFRRRSWVRYGRTARAGAYRATKGAAGFFGMGSSAAGMFGKAAGTVGLAYGATKEIYDLTQSLKQFSEQTFNRGRRLAAYNGDVATTFAMTDIQEGFRNRQLAAGTADTYKTLGGIVNLNRNYQVNTDTFLTNVQNRAGIAAGGLASGAQFVFSEISKGLNRVLDRVDPAGKNTEAATLGIWKAVFAVADAVSGTKQSDPNSQTAKFQRDIDNARKGVSLFDFDGFIAEAKNQKPLRANLQISL